MPNFPSLAALNDWLEARCRELWAQTPHGSQPGAIADVWTEEAGRPLSAGARGINENSATVVAPRRRSQRVDPLLQRAGWVTTVESYFLHQSMSEAVKQAVSSCNPALRAARGLVVSPTLSISHALRSPSNLPSARRSCSLSSSFKLPSPAQTRSWPQRQVR
jgi:hypothetical protein